MPHRLFSKPSDAFSSPARWRSRRQVAVRGQTAKPRTPVSPWQALGKYATVPLPAVTYPFAGFSVSHSRAHSQKSPPSAPRGRTDWSEINLLRCRERPRRSPPARFSPRLLPSDSAPGREGTWDPRDQSRFRVAQYKAASFPLRGFPNELSVQRNNITPG